MAAALKLQQQHGGQQPYLQAHHIQQSQQSAAAAALLAHHQQQQLAQAAQVQAQAQAQAQAQHQQRFEKNSPPNTVTVTQPNLMEAAALQYQQRGLLSRHPGAGGKVGSAPFGNEMAAMQQQQHQIHTFQQQHHQQYGKSQAALVHSQQQRGAPQTHTMMPHPPPPPPLAAAGGGVEPSQNQQMMDRQQRDANSELNKSGLSISAMPFVPTSNTPPTARKYNSSTPNVGEGNPPPPHSVSAVPVGLGGSHVTRPNAPLLQHVVLPAGHHMVPTPPPPPPPTGMLPMPRPRPQQMHISNPAQFQHPQVQRKTSASSAVAQGQSLLGGPAYQVIDKPHHPTGTMSRQLSGGEGSGGASKPPPGLSLPIRPGVMGEQGTTPTPPGVMMTGLDLQQARTMAMNRSGHALVNTTPMTAGAGYASVRPQHHHHQIHELSSLYGAPPTKMQPNVTTGGNKRALLPTPTAAAPIHAAQLSFLTGGGRAHHIAVAPSTSLPPGVQTWSGGNMHGPPLHRVPPPPSVTNQNSHRQQVMYTQEQVVQRSNYGSGYSGRGNGGGM